MTLKYNITVLIRLHEKCMEMFAFEKRVLDYKKYIGLL
jgi:hypothetical protein